MRLPVHGECAVPRERGEALRCDAAGNLCVCKDAVTAAGGNYRYDHT